MGAALVEEGSKRVGVGQVARARFAEQEDAERYEREREGKD
jgi:hypothetical protein